jgi:hypothetical protein
MKMDGQEKFLALPRWLISTPNVPKNILLRKNNQTKTTPK